MMAEGRIAIALFPGGHEPAVKIASSRPLAITRQFSGRRPKDVLRGARGRFYNVVDWSTGSTARPAPASRADGRLPVPARLRDP